MGFAIATKPRPPRRPTNIWRQERNAFSASWESIGEYYYAKIVSDRLTAKDCRRAAAWLNKMANWLDWKWGKKK